MSADAFARCDCTAAEGGYSCTCPCGAVIKSPVPKVFHACVATQQSLQAAEAKALSPPTPLQKAKNFATAAAKHLAAGMPMATEGELARRFAICQGCEFLKDGACLKCGCPVKREKAYLSKLAWADQSCPVGKWGPEDTGK